MGRFERIALTGWALLLEGVDRLGGLLGAPALEDWANGQWARAMARLDEGLNGST